MDDFEAQGSAESPSEQVIDNEPVTSEESVSDDQDILSHLNYGSTGEAPEEPEPEATEPEVEEESGAASEEPEGRYQQRINELVQKQQQAEAQAAALQQFLMNNTQAREAYFQTFGHPQGYQPQPQPQEAPVWDPYEPESVDAYVDYLFNQKAQGALQELEDLKQIVGGFVQQQQQSVQQQVVQSLDSVMFEAVPTAKDNEAHYFIAEGIARRHLSQLSPQDKQDPQKVSEVARKAADEAKKLVYGGNAPQKQTVTQTQKPNPVFSEGGQNMVNPRPKQPQSIEEGIIAHLNLK